MIGHSVMLSSNVDLKIQHMLFVPKVSKWIYLLIATGQHNCKSETMNMGTVVTQNGTPFIIGELKSNKLHYFKLVLAKNGVRYHE